MCGIIGYVGKNQALPILIKGLRDLEYRGYDSAGVAILDNKKFHRVRSVGKISELSHKLKGKLLAGTTGIAHTRWATHGGVTEKNAHPHFAADGKLVLVHNGIIENYLELKDKLHGQVKFVSETDSEILAHLIASYYQGDLAKAVRLGLQKVRGTYGILVAHRDHPDILITARLGSPIVIGMGHAEYFVASDVTPLLSHTKEVTYLEDGEIAELGLFGVKYSNLKDETITKDISQIDWTRAQAQKQGYKHFMLKEIFDQPTVFEDAIRGRVDMKEGTAHLGGLGMSEQEMRNIKRIIIISEGTAYHAGVVGKYAFEQLAQIPTEVDFSSEFRYRNPVIDKHTLVFAISQSGETLDTLMALREARRKGAVTRGIVNVIGSTIAREVGAGTYIHAGPELAVASTKAYTNMLAILILYALQFGRIKQTTPATGQRLIAGLLEMPKKMHAILADSDKVKRLARKYAGRGESVFFLGRGVNYPVALEGSLKLKEISYIPSEAFAGGQLKHGPLALLTKKSLVIGIVTKNQLYSKMIGNITEVRARGAKTLLVASKGDKDIGKLADDVIYIPQTMELLEPILNTIPLQLFAYFSALSLGKDVDRPRNLAKSVTVE